MRGAHSTRSNRSLRRSTVATLYAMAMAIASLTLIGCGPGGVASNAAAGFGSGSAVSAAKVADFMAVRRYTSFANSETSTYTERFVHADDGRVHVEALSLNGKLPQEMSAHEFSEFQALQTKMNLGGGPFIAVARDFQIRDANRFAQNYNASVVSKTAVVAGRSCVLTEVNPKLFDRPHYLVWADAATFVTLKYLEFLPSNALAAEMETTEVDFAYNAKKDAFPSLPITKPADVSSEQWSSLVNFKTFEPAYLPSGFVLDAVKLGTIATEPTLFSTYDDGLQQISVYQYLDKNAPSVEPPNYPDNAPLQIGATVIGGYVRTEFSIDGTFLHINGKVEPEEVKSMIESLHPAGP